MKPTALLRATPLKLATLLHAAGSVLPEGGDLESGSALLFLLGIHGGASVFWKRRATLTEYTYNGHGWRGNEGPWVHIHFYLI